MKSQILKDAMKMLKEYKPKAIWLDGDVIYVVTDDIDRSKYAKLIKKFK